VFVARRTTFGRRGTHRRRSGAAVLCTAVLVVSWVTGGVGSAQGADPAAPGITVTPATDLVDGQVVAVVGTGFTEVTDALVLQCPGTVEDVNASEAACDLSTAAAGTVGQDGTVTAELTVRRTLFVAGSQPIDCTVAPGCRALVSASDRQTGGAFEVAVADLAFAASGADEPDTAACPSPHAPYAHGENDGGSAIALPGVPVADAVPWRLAGAGLRVAADAESLTLEVTLDGTTELFTTLPYPPGRNYPNRAGGPGDAYGQGSVEIARTDDGAVFVVLERSDSGSYSIFAWRFADPCARPATQAVSATPSFTG
jgi:hypothetical protein